MAPTALGNSSMANLVYGPPNCPQPTPQSPQAEKLAMEDGTGSSNFGWMAGGVLLLLLVVMLMLYALRAVLAPNKKKEEAVFRQMPARDWTPAEALAKDEPELLSVTSHR
ncbi:hypothetical protein niasHT_018278 [Heterodera trifolii]|uniref:Uncharacterized protein n=1 Tax=Heterodera trifolii TaxID=157864 RepID=A0ABD2L8D3_9BILA